MNSLTRTLAKIATSEAQQASRRWILQSFSTSTTSKRLTQPENPSDSKHSAPKEWPRPGEIPYQSKVANSVSLSGYIHMPVQFEAASDGKFWAGTVIAQNPSSDSPPLWIPIIFEGDLAHIAACHLKENDHVYIDGQLSADPPSSNATHAQANVQVMVRTINFVDESPPMTKGIASHKQEGTLSHSAGTKQGTETAPNPWRDLLDNPKEWQDYRENKLNGLVKPKYPDFKHKDSGLALWLDSAPKWVLSELEGLQFDVPIQKPKQLNRHKGDGSWKDLVENPNKWWDNRLDKFNGKINERYPDFKHKETGEALWLTDSPVWVEPKLPSLTSKNGTANHERGRVPS
ncbi:Plastid transcriptionally active 9, putative [Theobroma cacao]|uniref:Plastid transcriptionally active 9, putative n=1 Tax=Theobroma cacao TaxID=3641 RepID=A0A061E3L2_THECC|nr:Plastid transcriptionally active 9, putative [Theobroma cacao]